jgi:hypothetical protein
MGEKPVKIFAANLAQNETMVIAPPDADTFYQIKSIYSSGNVEIFVRPTTVINGTGTSLLISTNTQLNQTSNLYSMKDCYIIIKNITSSPVQVYAFAQEITGPLFYMAQQVSAGGVTADVNFAGGNAGIVTTMMVAGGEGRLYINDHVHGVNFPTNIGVTSPTNTQLNLTYPDLKVGYDAAVAAPFGRNVSSTYGSIFVFMGIKANY